jgi:hypothetical protein
MITSLDRGASAPPQAQTLHVSDRPNPSAAHLDSGRIVCLDAGRLRPGSRDPLHPFWLDGCGFALADE